MKSRARHRMLLVVALSAVVALLPATGHAGPPQSDGSTYTWPGAAVLTVDVKPWGGGYVRSDPYLIDCPGACVRPFDPGREVTLTAYMTPGHTFKGWEGACAGQANPCTLKLSGTAIDVTAVLTGQYVPPKPPPSAAVNPQLSAQTVGADNCPTCATTYTGAGYHPNSSISFHFDYSLPAGGYEQDFANAEPTDANGAWTQVFIENCLFEGFPANTYHGPIDVTATATDTEGASDSTDVSMLCP
jgi:hypothetical protein